MEVDASRFSRAKCTHAYRELPCKCHTKATEELRDNFFMSLSAGPTSVMHRRNMAYQVLLAFAGVPTLITGKWFIIFVAEHMPVERALLGKFCSTDLASVPTSSMPLAHVQEISTMRLEGRTATAASICARIAVHMHVPG